jgi:hypothetical protein
VLGDSLRRLAAQRVKPHVSAEVWDRLRHLGGSSSAAEPNLKEERPDRPSLTDLAERFGTDKWGDQHRYTPHYERHLRHLRRRKFVLLEIGIGGYSRESAGGASLRMWKAFFPRATIVGLDIHDKRFAREERIHTVRGSQANPAVLDRIVTRFSPPLVVIDDGSHRPEHIRASFEHLFPRLPDQAIYAIEDTQTSYWPEWGGSEDLADPATSMNLVKHLVDGLNHIEFLDPDYVPSYTDLNVVGVHAYHNLVFIQKGDNRGQTLKVAANPGYFSSPPTL